MIRSYYRCEQVIFSHCVHLLIGMLGEAVKNPEMAQRYVNTHTQHTRVQKHILFKNSFKILIYA